MLVYLSCKCSARAAWKYVRAALRSGALPMLAAIVVGMVSLALAACGSSTQSAAPSPASLGQGSAHIPDLRLTDNELKQLEAQDGPLSAYQEKVLSDHLVTFTEYQAAVFAAVQCWQDEGLTITGYPGGPNPGGPGPVLTSRGLYQFLQMPPTEMTPDEAKTNIAKCNTEFVSALQPLWASHVAPSQQDIQAARDALAACLRGDGYDLPQHPTRDDFQRFIFPDGTPSTGAITFPAGFRDCQQKIDTETGISGFNGANA